MNDDDQKKHAQFYKVDDSAGENSPLGSAPGDEGTEGEGVMDIDKTANAMGIPTDTPTGPAPLNLAGELSNDVNK